MKWLKRFVYITIAAVLIGVAGYFVTRPKPVSVSVKKVEQGVIEATVVNTRAGTVKACRRAQLSPTIGGQIATWPVHEGMSVKKGDLLLALWNNDLKAQLDLAHSETEAAKSRADAVCLQADIAARQADRYRALKKAGATTVEQLDSRETEEQTRKAECRANRVTEQVSKARVALAQANFDRSLLHAPFDGVVADLNGELGEYVTPSPLGVQTLPTVDLIDTSCFYVSAPIDEVDLPKIKTGMSARITLDAFRNKAFSGKVTRIADYVLDLEKQARTVEVEVQFVDAQETAGLLPGYSADAEVIIKTKEGVLRVPTEAIVDTDKVFVYSAQTQKVVKKEIVKGLSNWDYTELLSGLAQGDFVVVTVDRPGLEDGVLVKAEVLENE